MRPRASLGLALALAIAPLAASALSRPGAVPIAAQGEIEAAACVAGGAARVTLGARLDIQSRDPAAWAALPGIGETLAARIVRAEPGSLEDLARVRGVGKKRAAALAAWLTDPSRTPEPPCR